MKRRTVAPAVLVAAALVAGGCNTFRGLGEDTQRLGQKMEEEAVEEEHEDRMDDLREEQYRYYR